MVEYDEAFYNNFHMDVNTFNALYNKIAFRLLPKRMTRPFDAVPPEHRLAIALE